MVQRYETLSRHTIRLSPNTYEVASAHLRRWINRCKPLHDALVKSGYTKWSKEFSPIQVAYIFDYLGEP